jgi:hypothetical protein
MMVNGSAVGHLLTGDKGQVSHAIVHTYTEWLTDTQKM